MRIQFLTNSEHLFLYLFICIGLVKRLNTGCLRDDIVEHFYYNSDSVKEKSSEQQSKIQMEFQIIGRKVTWSEARELCPSYAEDSMDVSYYDNDVDLERRANKEGRKLENGSNLAIFTDEEEANWFARMLSESNYRYEGLWIGGTRKNKNSSWEWDSHGRSEDEQFPRNVLFDTYPSWYHNSPEVSSHQNCLIFNRIGHDIPVFIPENCQLHRPFVCMRDVKRLLSDKIVEGSSVSVDGYHYTLYSVIDDTDRHYIKSGTEKLNGGGVTWKDAKIECHKRGKELAMVLTKEAGIAIADMMLKNRPSMENVWLGGWSSDGTDWTWIPTGENLPVEKSRTTGYPPWLESHPIVISKNDYYYQRTSRCLILDRHLCPGQIAPVFLDLDCTKERPFICQDGKGLDCPMCETFTGEGRAGLLPTSLARTSAVDDQEYEFSEEQMTYEDAEDYCINRDGQIADIINSKILSACLEKMSELSINHVWVGGRTKKINGEWHWVDSKDKLLSPSGVASESAWCLGEETNQFPKAEPYSCLNLDYETRGFPLFYGLPCNSTQVVLCSASSNSSIEKVVEVQSDEVDTRLLNTVLGNTIDTVKELAKIGKGTLKKIVDHANDKLNPKDIHHSKRPPKKSTTSVSENEVTSTAPDNPPRTNNTGPTGDNPEISTTPSTAGGNPIEGTNNATTTTTPATETTTTAP